MDAAWRGPCMVRRQHSRILHRPTWTRRQSRNGALLPSTADNSYGHSGSWRMTQRNPGRPFHRYETARDFIPFNPGYAITGVAGPGGGSAAKPVGLVHFAAAARDGRLIDREKRYGDIGRSEVRRLSVAEALAMLEELAGQTG